MKEVSLGNDGNISLDSLKKCINNDLANNYGNLCQRVFSFVEKNYSNKIPMIGKQNESDVKLLNNLKTNILSLTRLIDNQELNEYIKRVISYSFDANKYFNDSKPWAVKKENQSRCDTIICTIVEHIKNISILLLPIIPIAANNTLDILQLDKSKRNLESINNNNIYANNIKILKSKILFKKVDYDN